MGYELRLYVGKESSFEYEKNGINHKYFQVYAMVDICKPGRNSKVADCFSKNNNIAYNWYFWTDSGDSENGITEDRYGDKFDPVPIKTVIKALREDVKNDDYRRFKWALALLKSIQKYSEKEELSVIFYGY